MNAAQLYTDELYAYVDQPPKGRTPIGAAKVRVRGTESRKATWDTNRRTYALITVVQPGNMTDAWAGGYNHAHCKAGDELSVPARHIVDFWDSYESEVRLLEQEEQERRDKQRRYALREQVLTTALLWKLQNEKGVHVLAPTVHVNADGSGSVTFPLDEMLRWLEISMEEISDKVEELMEN